MLPPSSPRPPPRPAPLQLHAMHGTTSPPFKSPPPSSPSSPLLGPQTAVISSAGSRQVPSLSLNPGTPRYLLLPDTHPPAPQFLPSTNHRTPRSKHASNRFSLSSRNGSLDFTPAVVNPQSNWLKSLGRFVIVRESELVGYQLYAVEKW